MDKCAKLESLSCPAEFITKSLIRLRAKELSSVDALVAEIVRVNTQDKTS